MQEEYHVCLEVLGVLKIPLPWTWTYIYIFIYIYIKATGSLKIRDAAFWKCFFSLAIIAFGDVLVMFWGCIEFIEKHPNLESTRLSLVRCCSFGMLGLITWWLNFGFISAGTSCRLHMFVKLSQEGFCQSMVQAILVIITFFLFLGKATNHQLNHQLSKPTNQQPNQPLTNILLKLISLHLKASSTHFTHGLAPWFLNRKSMPRTKPFNFARIRSWAAICCVMLLQSGIFCPTFNILTLQRTETVETIQRDGLCCWLVLVEIIKILSDGTCE